MFVGWAEAAAKKSLPKKGKPKEIVPSGSEFYRLFLDDGRRIICYNEVDSVPPEFEEKRFPYSNAEEARGYLESFAKVVSNALVGKKMGSLHGIAKWEMS